MSEASKSSIRAFAPATVANVACAFDILGFALDGLGDEVVVSLRGEPGVVITQVHGGGGKLPLKAEKNTAGVSVLALLKELQSSQGLSIELFKNLPLGSGLGSSAASAAASVFAANELLGRPLSVEQLLPFAMEAERVACGAAHADNVGPALLGGFVLIRSYAPLDVIKIDPPTDLWCVVVHPELEVRTEDARRVLKQKIALKDAVVQWGNTAGLITGLLRSDYGLIGRSLQDVIIEPERADLIPGFYAVKNAALAAGALGCSISGSGPAIFSFVGGGVEPESVGQAMQAAFKTAGVASSYFSSKIGPAGAREVKQ